MEKRNNEAGADLYETDSNASMISEKTVTNYEAPESPVPVVS